MERIEKLAKIIVNHSVWSCSDNFYINYKKFFCYTLYTQNSRIIQYPNGTYNWKAKQTSLTLIFPVLSSLFIKYSEFVSLYNNIKSATVNIFEELWSIAK